MSLIPDFPQILLDFHHQWHMPGAHPEAGPGRLIPAGLPGSGLEFLTFHRNYVSQFHAWYDIQPFANPAAVAGWSSIPGEVRTPVVGWNMNLANQEIRITTNDPPLRTADELGTFIENGIHNWIHGATALAFSEPIVAGFQSPQSTFFYNIHGLVENWWQSWESGQLPPPIAVLTVGADASQASIGQPGETDMYRFVVLAAGTFTIQTQGTTDVVMSLFGPNNLAALVTEDDDSGEELNARIVSTLSAGTYYVRIRHYYPSSTGNYRISVQGGPLPIPEIPVNGGPVEGNIAAANESDVYTFTAGAAGVFIVETAGDTDTLLTLFGPDSQTAFIAQDDDSGPGLNSRIVANIDAAVYYARVRHYSPTGTGPYSISVRQ